MTQTMNIQQDITQKTTTELDIVADQHVATLTGGHRPEDAHPADGKVKVEDLHPEICAPAIKDSPKHARQTRLQIVRKDAKGNVVSEADVAAKAAVAVAAKVATEKAAAPKAAKTAQDTQSPQARKGSKSWLTSPGYVAWGYIYASDGT